MAHGLEAIDWSAPWLEPWRSPGQQGADLVRHGLSCAQALNHLAEVAKVNAVVFVEQTALPRGMAYEQFIFTTGQVPTRNGLHDFFNGLCWLQFSHTKRRLNQLQAAQIAQQGIAAARGAVRDALTVLDENAAFLQATDAVWTALVAKDWVRLFGELRSEWGQARLLLFGHALLEKLVTPRKAITAHVYRVPGELPNLVEIDFWLAAEISPQQLATQVRAHLPVLGVPGWHAANRESSFYADLAVFRPVKGHKIGVQLHT